jgi:DNA-binding FadR family transcriptional regulator
MTDGQQQAPRTERAESFRPAVVEPRSAADQIARQLRDALTTGTLRPGDRLDPEPDMAAAFGVSRATLREAIKILRAQGVLRTQRGARGGHFVVSPQTEVLAESVGQTFGLWFDAGDISVAEVDEARLYVERACVALAAQRRTDDDLADLRGILEDAADPSLTLEAFLHLEVMFHRRIAQTARNRLLELPMTAIHIVRPRTNKLLRRPDRSVVLAQHTALYDAIAAGDPDEAEHALLNHVAFLERERAAAVAARHRDARDIAVADLDEET